MRLHTFSLNKLMDTCQIVEGGLVVGRRNKDETGSCVPSWAAGGR